MSSPPTQGGAGPPEEPQSQLNRFGRWVVALNTILGTTMEEMAARIGYNKGSFSSATRGSDYSMSRQTFQDLIKEYRLLAQERQIVLPVTWTIFIGLSWIDGHRQTASETDPLMAQEKQALGNIEMLAGIYRERNQLRKENERLKKKPFRAELLAQIEVLERENERLQLRLAWLERIRENSQQASANTAKSLPPETETRE